MSLKNKICGAFLLCLLVTLVPLVFTIQLYIKPMQQAEAQHQAMQLVDAKAQEIGSWLNQRISEMRIIHQYPPCKTLDFSQLKPYLGSLNLVLSKKYGNVQETFAIGGLDGKGWINDDITIDVSARDYFLEAMRTEREYVISEPVVSKANRDPIFLLCYPIRAADGSKVGFINGAINLNLMSQITHSIDIYNGTAWVMNRKGDVYANSAQLMGDKQVTPEVLAAIAAQAQQGSGMLELRTAGDTGHTAFFAPVPYAPDWVLCTMIENSQMNRFSQQMIDLLLTACLLLVVIAIGLALLISRSITRPVEVLKTQMLQVSKGDLDSVYPSRGNDEISVLGTVFNQMVAAIKQLMQEVLDIQVQKRKAELRALQSQITPHFLYNTLDTIQWKALSYQAFEVADMIQLLSRFFRISLSDGKEYIPIEEELSHVTSYLQIQEVRYRDLLSHRITAPPELYRCKLPKLLIQPLVENAIYHGIKPKDCAGLVDIRLEAVGDRLRITVTDDGVGMSEAQLRDLRDSLSATDEREHYGLYNISERLRLTYHDRQSLRIESAEGQGTAVTIELPLEVGDNEC